MIARFEMNDIWSRLSQHRLRDSFVIVTGFFLSRVLDIILVTVNSPLGASNFAFHQQLYWSELYKNLIKFLYTCEKFNNKFLLVYNRSRIVFYYSFFTDLNLSDNFTIKKKSIIAFKIQHCQWRVNNVIHLINCIRRYSVLKIIL